MTKRPIGPVTGKRLILCKYCKKNWGQELPAYGPQNVCYECGARICRDNLTATNPLWTAIQKGRNRA